MLSLFAKFRLLLFVALCCNFAGSSEKTFVLALWQQPQSAQHGYLQVRVVDQNGIATGAKITILRGEIIVSTGEVPASENSRFPLPRGTSKILVENQIIYAALAEQ